MRPLPLFPLFASLETLPGVGAAMAKTLTRLTGGGRVVDLLWHLPTGVIDRHPTPSIMAVRPGAMATLTVRVVEHGSPRSRRQPWRVLCEDASGEIVLVFFNARSEWLLKVLPPGETRVVSGMAESYGDALQIVHPDYIVEPAAAADALPTIEPVYPMTTGLAPKLLLKAVRAAVDRAPCLDEWLDPALRSQRAWPAWRDAVIAVHSPARETDLAPTAPAGARLAYDELLANQLALAVVRRRWRRQPGRALRSEGKLAASVLERLSFTLTASQQQALSEISHDMAHPSRMLRLLQGDVGSGKTVVALLAMLIAVEAGAQAALMAPTELLARQHLATIGKLAKAASVRVALLTGREKEGARRATIECLKSGGIDIIVGTHALLQETVIFRDLAVAVIDEQHRFGVDQRLALASKGERTDVLVMSATPIPRTLTLTAYGDLDISRLTEKPPGRRPVDTRVVPADRLEEVTSALGRMLASGAKAYWVCPLVEESETLDLAAAEARHAALAKTFPGQVALVHGRMKSAERDAAMRAFRDGPPGVLVATTVIEVGVDVPAATVMVIEHAERFGLAQLHQLRGRVGRSTTASTCILLYAPPITEAARLRLAVLRDTDDGFRIAEEDLRLRGAGDVLGVKQSGLPAFRLADLAVHADLLAIASDDARLVLEQDPELTSPRGRALRTLLYLFERDAVIRTLRAG
jgi:ATP-dependent DNA helicase RecG